MASTIAAVTTGGGGVITTADSSGNLSLLSGVNTVVAVTSTGASVTGTLAATGAVTASTTLAVTGASTFTGTGKFATTIGVGNATPAASGSGITFPATQSASSDANTLDDYEEGTWTPSQGGGLTVIGAFSSNGTYTKVGRLVTVTAQVIGATSVAITAGDAIVCSNLPFASLGAPNYVGGLINGLATAAIFMYVGSTNFRSSGTMSATGNMSITISYFV